MNFIKFIKILYTKILSSNNREPSGMKDSSRKISFKKGIGLSYFTPRKNTSRGNFALDGWGHMMFIMYMKMDL
jgi:hypothetical protein